MSDDRFMELVRSWRKDHADLREAYLAAIPQQVAASMAFEGDRVDIAFLRENLSRV